MTNSSPTPKLMPKKLKSLKQPMSIFTALKLAKRPVMVASVVGPILVIINQDGALTAPWGLDPAKVALTFLTPFLVSLFMGVMAVRGHRQDMADFNEVHLAQVEGLEQQARALTSELGTLKAAQSNILEKSGEIEVESTPSPTPTLFSLAPQIEPKFDSPPAVDAKRAQQNQRVMEAIQSAKKILKQIQTNAMNVNTTSRERVVFVDGLISRGTQVGIGIGDLITNAETTTQAINQIRTDVGNISADIEMMHQNTTAAAQPMEQITELTARFRATFSKAKDASELNFVLAKQTRQLAINTTIEAAHAGDAGKGFMVIAKEVRSLSEDSAQHQAIISDAMTDAGQLADQLSDMIQLLADTLAKNQKTNESCSFNAVATNTDVSSLADNVVKFGADTAAQLPQVSQLVTSLHDIKSNTEAAVVGSQKNIQLCEETMTMLSSANSSFTDTSKIGV